MREGGEGREEGSRAGVEGREAMGFLTPMSGVDAQLRHRQRDT